MKIIEKYIDEISKREFKTREDAIKSEKKNDGIKKLFSFWTYQKDDGTRRFANGEWCYQRTDVDYLRLIDSLIKAVIDYEPWIAKQYESHGGLQRKHIGSGFMIGRYLDDGGSELYHWYGILSNICSGCFREWGQPYYAINCKHTAKPKANQ